MFLDDLFSLGLITPLLLLFAGYVAIGVLFAVAATIARLRAVPDLKVRNSQLKIDLAIVILASSELLAILGGSILHKDMTTGLRLVGVGMFLLWPVSALLALWGRGAGRRVLLVGHGLIALLATVLFLIVWIHGY